MSDISAILKSSKLALEKQATDKFGSAVEDFARGALGYGVGVAPSARISNRDPYAWSASSYAAALAGGTDYRPKLKFLFKVEFIFTPEAIAAYPQLKSQDFTFMIKSVDRPKIDFEYEDDVNQYNFRTKALKRIRHRELTVTFMDDTGNRVFDFFRTLMFLHSPITQRSLNREPGAAPSPLTITEGNGMAFTSATSLGDASQEDIAHRGVINGGAGAVGGSISCIRVKQMFVNPAGRISAQNIKTVDPQEVTYDFLNPRIVSFDLDDLTHESSDPSLLTMQFDYDWMEMVKVGQLYEASSPTYNITAPGVTGAPVDILGGSSDSGPVGAQGAVGISPAGGGNPFLNILTNQASRAAQKITADAVNRTVSQIAGRGQLGGLVAGALTPIAAGVSGLISTGARDLIVGAASAAKGTFTSSTRPTATDSATRTNDGATIVRSTNGSN